MLARRAGFSLIELMIAVAIMALLVVMGLPAFNTYMQNAKIRAVAETFYTGLQAARAEAVRRNGTAEFVMTTDEAVSANVNTANLSTNATNWIVRTPNLAMSGTYLFVGGKSSKEGGGLVEVNGGGTTTVTFNGFGATTLGSAATFAFTSAAGGACATATTPGMRCLNVVVSIGGQAKLCDPAVNTAGDTRKC